MTTFDYVMIVSALAGFLVTLFRWKNQERLCFWDLLVWFLYAAGMVERALS